MKINFRKLFGEKNSLQKLYPENSFSSLIASENKYPLFTSLETSKIYAYSTRFMIKSNDLLRVREVIERCFHKKLIENTEILSFGSKTLHYFQFKEFGQVVIDIITNDNNLIQNTIAAELEPPLPNVVFPERSVESFGGLQGDVETWWNIYWNPFWVSLSQEEKKHYIEQENISGELKEFLFLHI
ncbi:hypothetical protein ACQYRI_13260 [Salmonella enterica]